MRWPRSESFAKTTAWNSSPAKSLHRCQSEAPTQVRSNACLNQIFTRLAGGRCIVSVQDPIALDSFTEPEPDLALLHPREDFYANAHPGPDDVLVIVDVADSSLVFDRDEKIPLYAAAGIAEVWLVDLVDKSVGVYRRPTHGAYTEITRHCSGATIAIPGLPEAQLAVNELAL